MAFHFYPWYHFTALVCLVISLVLAVISVQRHYTSGTSIAPAMLMLAVSVWTLTSACELACDNISAKLVWSHIGDTGIVFIPLAWLISVLDCTGRRALVVHRYFAALCIIPFITVILTWTDSYHHLMYARTWIEVSHNMHYLAVANGSWFWVFVGYSYIVIACGLMSAIHSMLTSSTFFRKQMIILVIAACIPIAANIIGLLDIGIIPGFDFTPIAFTVTGAVLILGVTRYKLWQLTPIAHQIVLRTMTDGIMVLDSSHRIVEINPSACRLLDISEREIIGHTIESALPELEDLYISLGKKKQVIEITITVENQPDIIFEVTVKPFNHRVASQTAWILVFRDITERRLLEERLHYLAFYDPLTDIPNRALFTDRLEQVLAQGRRQNTMTGLMFMDLDRFKEVNDTLGHSAGDDLLKQVANRLSTCIRESDTIARLGGDEFVIIAPNLHCEEDAISACDRLMTAFTKPFVLLGQCQQITPSIGYTLAPREGDTVDSLMRCADLAMYSAKRNGGGRISGCAEGSLSNDV